MAKVRWHARNRCWTANIGEPDKRGKRKPVYAPFAGIPAGEAGRRAAQRVADSLDKRQRVVPAAALTVEDLVNLYLAGTSHKKSASTDKAHQSLLQSFCNFRPRPDATPYGLRQAASVKTPDLQNVVDAWQRAGHSASYISHLVSVVRGVWRWAATPVASRDPVQILPANEIGSVDRPKIRAKPVAYAERKDLARFLHFLWRDINANDLTYPNGRCSACYGARKPGPCRRPHHEKAYAYRETVLLIRFAMNTGCRPGEVRELEWSEVDWNLSAAVQYKGKKWTRTGQPRVIIIPPLMLRALRRHYDRGPRDDRWCFTHQTRSRPGKAKPPREPWTDSDLANRIRFWRKRAFAAKAVDAVDGEMRIHLYKLRHKSITDALHAGVPTPLAAELHGTSEKMVRETYGHIQPSALHAAMEQIRAYEQSQRARRRGDPAPPNPAQPGGRATPGHDNPA